MHFTKKFSTTSIIVLVTIFLISCGAATYTFIAGGQGQQPYTRFNVKHIKDGCCGCSGILVNSFRNDKLESQLFVESNDGCPFKFTKFNFHYSSNGNLIKVDTMIAVVDSSYQYPITDIDKIALIKIDSFIAVQNSTSYVIRKIDIKGYRHKTEADKNKLMLLPPRLDKQALY